MLARRTLLRAAVAAPAALAAALAWDREAPAAAGLSPDIHIGYGQSDRSYEWPSFGKFGLTPPPTLLALHVWANSGGKEPGPLPANGILPGVYQRIDGITQYTSADHITIGRCAAMTELLLRPMAGTPSAPLLEYCHAYPACNWTACVDARGGGLQPGGIPWQCGLAADRAIEALVRAGRLAGARFRSVGYTQGGAKPDTVAQKFADMQAMLADYDALALPGTATRPLHFFITHQGEPYGARVLSPSFYGTAAFVRANANGRTWGTTPIAQWRCADGWHTDAYGMCRIGEFEGYAMHVVYGEGLGRFYPLWRSLTRPITVHGQTVSVPFDRPSGRGFAAGALTFHYDATDGLIEWPQRGFHVRRHGVELGVTPSIEGLDVRLTIAERLDRGDQLEISYAAYGPGGADKSRSGIGGNLMMVGPPSPLFPGKRINAWAWPFIETATA